MSAVDEPTKTINDALDDLVVLGNDNERRDKSQGTIDILIDLYRTFFRIPKDEFVGAKWNNAQLFALVAIGQASFLSSMFVHKEEQETAPKPEDIRSLLAQFLTTVLKDENKSALDMIKASTSFTSECLRPTKKHRASSDYLNSNTCAVTNLAPGQPNSDGKRLNRAFRDSQTLPKAHFEEDEAKNLYLLVKGFDGKCEKLPEFAESIDRALFGQSLTETQKETMNQVMTSYQNEINDGDDFFSLTSVLTRYKSNRSGLVRSQKINPIETKWFNQPYPLPELEGKHFLLAVELITPGKTKLAQTDRRATLFHPPTGIFFPTAERYDNKKDTGEPITLHAGPTRVGTSFRENITLFDRSKAQTSKEQKKKVAKLRNALRTMLTCYFFPFPTEQAPPGQAPKRKSRGRPIEISNLFLLTVEDQEEEVERDEGNSQ